MIGFHFQAPVNDWPRAAARLPAGTPLKAIDNVQLLNEAKSINPGLKTILRHFYDAGQIFGGTLEDNKARARAFFATFVDGTFRSYAKSVDFIEEWNEYFANSQNATEVAQRVTWATAAAQVWRDEYRSQAEYAHIRLVLANTAIGNDIPLEYAQLATQYDCVLGYHPYIPVTNGVIKAGEWPNYSGRFTEMDKRFKAAGYAVEWLFTEGGPVYEYAPGSLDPGGGWRHPNVYGGNVEGYVAAMRYWLDKTAVWNAANGGRARGVVLFTSGGGDWWKWFETKQPEMDALADLAATYTPPVIEPPDPPAKDDGLPRVQYKRNYRVVPQAATLNEWLSVCTDAFAEKRTVGFSYDDAGIGALDDKTAVLYGIPLAERQAFIDWYQTYYPATKLAFRDYPN